MAGNLGTLSVTVAAETRKFMDGMSKSRKALSTLSTGFSRATKLVAGFGTALIGLAGIGGGIAALRQAASEIDNIAKTARKIGATTEALSGLRFAASQTGVAAGQLDKGLEKMVIRISEATQGTGEATKALEQLKLSAIEMNELGVDEQFKRVADALLKVENANDRARIAYELFGRAGTSLLNTIAGGSDAISKFQSEAEKLGITFSEEEAKKVERFNDAMDRLRRVTQGIAREIIIEISPAAESAVRALQEIIQGLKLIRRPPGGVSDDFVSGLARAARQTIPVNRAVSSGQSQVRRLVDMLTARGVAEGGQLTPEEAANVSATGSPVRSGAGGLDQRSRVNLERTARASEALVRGARPGVALGLSEGY